MSTLIPKAVTGGCLCGGVRYQITFAPDHDWKRGPHTCQCTQCRKNSGSLIPTFHTVKTSELTWLSKSTYAEYNSSPNCYRTFCKNCGSFLSWNDRSVPEDVELAVGSLDEEFLVGERDSEDKPLGAFGVALANPEGDHFYVRNEIAGVTDGFTVRGRKYWKGSEGGGLEALKDLIYD